MIRTVWHGGQCCRPPPPPLGAVPAGPASRPAAPGRPLWLRDPHPTTQRRRPAPRPAPDARQAVVGNPPRSTKPPVCALTGSPSLVTYPLDQGVDRQMVVVVYRVPRHHGNHCGTVFGPGGGGAQNRAPSQETDEGSPCGCLRPQPASSTALPRPSSPASHLGAPGFVWWSRPPQGS